MFRFDVLLNFIMLAGFAAIASAVLVRRGESPFRALYVVLFALSAYAAYALKLGNTGQLASVFTPFYKLYSINEYGYASILNDLVRYSMPFMLTGFFFLPAFPKAGLLPSFLSGAGIALCFNVYYLFEGGSFVTDEYVFAGLGMAAGTAIYVVLAYIFKKKLPMRELHLPIPPMGGYGWALGILAAIYFGIALVMIFDYGEPYSDIQFFESETPLPEELSLNCQLSDTADKQYIYVPSTQPIEERLTAIAQSVGILEDISVSDGVYTAENEHGKVTMTENGSWVYDNLDAAEGALPSKESAVNAVFRFFSSRQILSIEIDEVTDIVDRQSASTGAFAGYDVYLSTSVNGNPIADSNTIVVSVLAGDAIAKIRRYNGDIQTGALVNAISSQRAYESVLSGDCAYTLFAPASSASIESCELVYMANSSQGYYLPVWNFHCTVVMEDGSLGEFDIYVQANR